MTSAPTNTPAPRLELHIPVSGITQSASSENTTLCLLSGTLPEFETYTDTNKVNWLLDVAHDLCDPIHKRGQLLLLENDADRPARPVNPTEPLTAARYLYHLESGVPIRLTKLSVREARSISTRSARRRRGSYSSSDIECDSTTRLRAQGAQCCITDYTEPLADCRVLPRRMGATLGGKVYETFTGSPLAPGAEFCGHIPLSLGVSGLWRTYTLGFREMADGSYRCHFFGTLHPGHTQTVYGQVDLNQAPYARAHPLLHGHPARIPPQVHPGIIRWHYLQCVLKRFADAQYRELRDIEYESVSVRLEGDSEDEWPSAQLDTGEEQEQTKKKVDAWRQSSSM